MTALTTTIVAIGAIGVARGLLYPQDNELRTARTLDDPRWTFVMETPNSNGYGVLKQWWKHDLSMFVVHDCCPNVRASGAVTHVQNASSIPVPSAFNDLYQSRDVRDFVGYSWYQRKIVQRIDQDITNRRFVLRFGSVNYFASVVRSSACNARA